MKTKLPTITTERAIIGTALVASTVASGVIVAGATKIVVGKVAVPGAIATANVVVNGTTYVMSKVALGLGYKLLFGALWATGLGYLTYHTTKVLIKKVKEFKLNSANKKETV